MLDLDDLRAYQLRGIEHIKENPNCALWEDMGLGKSVQAATAILELSREFEIVQSLIIAPLRVARKTWPDELKEWQHLRHLTIATAVGTSQQRIDALKSGADIVTINRENVDWLVQQFLEYRNKRWRQVVEWPFDVVVLDESSSFKSQSAIRWKRLKLIRRLFPRMIQLTGTPAPNGYDDLWAQMYLLDRGERLGMTETSFRQRWFESDFSGFKYMIRPGAKEQIQAQLKDIVLTLRADDYMDLPPVIYNVVPASVPDVAMRVYKYLEKNYVAEWGDKMLNAVNKGVLFGKLLQLANGAVYTEGDSWERIHDGKIDALLELLDGVSGPCLVAYSFIHDLERLRPVLDKWAKHNRKTWSILKTVADEDRWNAGEIDVMLLHPASAGHGLNLQKSGATTIIWFGLTVNLEWYAQLNARLAGGLRRIGKNIIVHLIVAQGTIDERAVWILTQKDATQEELLNSLNGYVRSVK